MLSSITGFQLPIDLERRELVNSQTNSRPRDVSIIVATQQLVETLQARLEDEGLREIDKGQELPRLGRSEQTSLREPAQTLSQGNGPSEKQEVHPATELPVPLGMRLPSKESLARPQQGADENTGERRKKLRRRIKRPSSLTPSC